MTYDGMETKIYYYNLLLPNVSGATVSMTYVNSFSYAGIAVGMESSENETIVASVVNNGRLDLLHLNISNPGVWIDIQHILPSGLSNYLGGDLTITYTNSLGRYLVYYVLKNGINLTGYSFTLDVFSSTVTFIVDDPIALNTQGFGHVIKNYNISSSVNVDGSTPIYPYAVTYNKTIGTSNKAFVYTPGSGSVELYTGSQDVIITGIEYQRTCDQYIVTLDKQINYGSAEVTRTGIVTTPLFYKQILLNNYGSRSHDITGKYTDLDFYDYISNDKVWYKNSFCLAPNWKLTSPNSQKDKLNLSPNPVINELNLEGVELDITKNIQIFNISGQLVNIIPVNSSIDLSNLEQGNYIIEIPTIQGVVREKIVKE